MVDFFIRNGFLIDELDNKPLCIFTFFFSASLWSSRRSFGNCWTYFKPWCQYQYSRWSVTKWIFSETPLHKACEYGHIRVVIYLISQGADIDIMSKGNNGGTPLQIATSNGFLNIVQYLVSKNADVNSKNESTDKLFIGWLPYMMLQIMGIFPLLSFLLKMVLRSIQQTAVFNYYLFIHATA